MHTHKTYMTYTAFWPWRIYFHSCFTGHVLGRFHRCPRPPLGQAGVCQQCDRSCMRCAGDVMRRACSGGVSGYKRRAMVEKNDNLLKYNGKYRKYFKNMENMERKIWKIWKIFTRMLCIYGLTKYGNFGSKTHYVPKISLLVVIPNFGWVL